MTVYHFIKQNGTLTTDNYSLKPYTPDGFNRALVSLTFDDGYASTYDNGLPHTAEIRVYFHAVYNH